MSWQVRLAVSALRKRAILDFIEFDSDAAPNEFTQVSGATHALCRSAVRPTCAAVAYLRM